MSIHGVMVDPSRPKSGECKARQPRHSPRVNEVTGFMGSVGHPQGVELSLPPRVPTYIRLNFEELNCFQVVDRQFERYGVIFDNAIALSPSNPAFPTHKSRIVLMGAPKSGSLEVTFTQPVSFITSLVTSSRRTVLSAYDNQGTRLAQTDMVEPNLAGSSSQLHPNAPLSLSVPNIHRAVFYAFDGHLTVAEFGFSV